MHTHTHTHNACTEFGLCVTPDTNFSFVMFFLSFLIHTHPQMGKAEKILLCLSVFACVRVWMNGIWFWRRILVFCVRFYSSYEFILFLTLFNENLNLKSLLLQCILNSNNCVLFSAFVVVIVVAVVVFIIYFCMHCEWVVNECVSVCIFVVYFSHIEWESIEKGG